MRLDGLLLNQRVLWFEFIKSPKREVLLPSTPTPVNVTWFENRVIAYITELRQSRQVEPLI